MNIPENLKYSREHEWIRVEGEEAVIGITDYAQGELGDIVFIEVESLEEELGRNEIFGTIEAVKTVSDLFMPVGGEVMEFNENLEAQPELVNEDPYGKGWLIRIRVSDLSELEELMDHAAYQDMIA